ncbi:hypothetical protein IQ13_3421 [Lacibacter cauensis]|uniref:Type II CBASS E2 protein domain-containing protein n=1 Tax=Lacibacter cauensis TaxID=510947 RepID=A0A562SCF9_9BACT|nr:hypothetical protein [Lacibacter cauensis]TWI79029.1 hypothetical protein IQ13_3421 [Lacibacter cauensis]
MASKLKHHSLNMGVQAGRLRSVFPSSTIRFSQNELTWESSITPTPLSSIYEVKLHYVRGENPNVYVVAPKLILFPGESTLPHVYDTEKQWLCLYYRKAKEWNSNMLVADTVVPWACEWLCHYEIWLCTGTWQGGGIHNETGVEKQADKQKETIDEASSRKKQS